MHKTAWIGLELLTQVHLEPWNYKPIALNKKVINAIKSTYKLKDYASISVHIDNLCTNDTISFYSTNMYKGKYKSA